MEVKVHWIIDGIAEMDIATPEEAEQKVDEALRALIANNKELFETLGARAIQGKAYLPGSEDDIKTQED
ncbi:translation initiation factor IF-2 [SAR116 cluster bacterium]|nr:translation initiation factor IF-2 [SAR116 cluster bacterium]